ncbi:hypothetical protein OQA88_9934 [Cercophora sp. LCS_1]
MASVGDQLPLLLNTAGSTTPSLNGTGTTSIISTLTSWENVRYLTSQSLTLILFSAFLAYDITRRVRRWHRLKHIPGPWIAGWTNLWYTYQNYLGKSPDAVKRAFERYGSVIRIGPNEVMTTDVDTLHHISGVKSGWRKDRWYIIGKMGDASSILVLLEPEERKERKKKIAPAYAGKGTDSFEEGVDRGMSLLIDSLEERYASKKIAVNLGRHIHYMALDTLGEVAYSQDLGFLKNNKDMGDFLKINDQMIPIIATLSNYTSLFLMLNKWPLNLLLPRAGDQSGLGAVMGFTAGLIDDRLKPGAKPKRDILQSFINNGLNRAEVLVEVTLQFFAGTDTTASVVTLCLLYLVTNPTAYRKLQSELDAASLSTPILSDAEARSLPYLQACIRETLRLTPPLSSGAFYKEVPPAGDTLCGVFVPGGVRVGTNASMYAVGRDGTFWGVDAEVFRPGRWIEADDGLRAAMQTRVDLVFGHGQFVCMGKAIALMEVGKAVAEVMRRYDLSIVSPIDGGPEIISAVAWMIRGLQVMVEKREGVEL